MELNFSLYKMHEWKSTLSSPDLPGQGWSIPATPIVTARKPWPGCLGPGGATTKGAPAGGKEEGERRGKNGDRRKGRSSQGTETLSSMVVVARGREQGKREGLGSLKVLLVVLVERETEREEKGRGGGRKWSGRHGNSCTYSWWWLWWWWREWRSAKGGGGRAVFLLLEPNTQFEVRVAGLSCMLMAPCPWWILIGLFHGGWVSEYQCEKCRSLSNLPPALHVGFMANSKLSLNVVLCVIASVSHPWYLPWRNWECIGTWQLNP